ncbi:hypothetical protein BB8028_0002g02150 [Beauveria bassiana]|uniref:Uncharacterized protein n=1 Tax=Beauveria bassiana TaxID=176275 RepID=A0A2S7Y197_BEABA|nr:hypothetical protein BB8028_0002g02150 [Beauveria bassiana]
MRALTATAPRLLSRLSRQHPNGFWLSATSCAQLLRPLRRHPAAAVLCLYSTKAPAKMAEVVSKRQADATLAAAKSKATYEIPERLLIYHAGTGRTTFLAMLKVTTLFIGAFFCFVAVPSYISADKPVSETVKIALCGVIPFFFVTYTTAPFVTHLYIHLPVSARTSRAALERFVRAALPPSARLTATTMSAIGKPRYSTLCAGDLRPVKRRFGLVNYARDAGAENRGRRWYELPAVKQFHVPEGGGGGGAAKDKTIRKEGRRLVEPWIWDAIKEKIAKRSGEAGGAAS